MNKDLQKYELLPVADLVPYDKNARTHSAEQIERIGKSIKEFGFINPVLINAENVIIAGHGRVEAARLIGYDAVPCLRVEHLTEAQMRAYVIADNKLAEDAGWNMDIINEELVALQDMDFDVSLTGFDLDLGNDEPEEKDLSNSIAEVYEVIVECKDETEQENLFDRLQAEGLSCRVLTL